MAKRIHARGAHAREEGDMPPARTGDHVMALLEPAIIKQAIRHPEPEVRRAALEPFAGTDRIAASRSRAFHRRIVRYRWCDTASRGTVRVSFMAPARRRMSTGSRRVPEAGPIRRPGLTGVITLIEEGRRLHRVRG